MAEKSKCYWTKDSYCGVGINQNENEIFIIGSCDITRRKFINEIKDVVENEFKMKSVFAEDLSQHNGYKAFCSNICSPIISSALVIVDLSAPYTNISCSSCNQEIETLQQSVNVYWEYGYACGLAKRILLLIDKTQIDKLPFDVADTQIQAYAITNLRDKIRELIKIKLSEPLPPNRYNLILPPLPTTPIGPNDHRIQLLIELVKYKAVDYYREIKPEKKKEYFKLIEILGTFNSIFLKYLKGGGVTQIIEDYFDMPREDLQSHLKRGERVVDIPRRSTLVMAGDFCFKVQKYKLEHPEMEQILIRDVHGEFDTEIRSHRIFPQSLSFDREFLPALEELRKHGFIRGEPYKGQKSSTEFIIPSQAYLKGFIEIYSLDYYFQQHFNLR